MHCHHKHSLLLWPEHCYLPSSTASWRIKNIPTTKTYPIRYSHTFLCQYPLSFCTLFLPFSDTPNTYYYLHSICRSLPSLSSSSNSSSCTMASLATVAKGQAKHSCSYSCVFSRHAWHWLLGLSHFRQYSIPQAK